MTISRAACEAAFRDALAACDPRARVRDALAREPLPPPVIGLAVGKAALAMARGAAPVERGLVITGADDGRGVPPRWRLVRADHPVPGQASLAAGREAIALVDALGEADTLLVLVSGGASAMLEAPAPGVTLDDLRAATTDAMARGLPIHALNERRTSLSAVKGGKLGRRARGRVVTLVASDVIGDDPRVVGSGPTVRDGDRVEVVAPIARFGEAVQEALARAGLVAARWLAPMTGDVGALADRLAAAGGALVAWGEPTLRLPASPGIGGRAQQLARELARRLRGADRSAFVAGSDGIDGNSHAAGAYVDGSTWDRIADPEDALARCDATSALGAVGALVVTGPTGVNHADVVILG